MKIFLITFTYLFATIFSSSCTTTSEVSTAGKAARDEPKVSWFQGSVEDAMALSAKTGKPMFIYWGAVWCPPCNEIKAQIFPQRRFAELMQDVIPIYLDGDTKAAQVWGDNLEISGYPTLLILDSGKNELMRINESVSLSEFSAAFEAGLASNASFKDTLQRALDGKAELSDWRRLAYFSWYHSRGIDLNSKELLLTRQKLADQVPQELIAERALLSARLLEAAAENADHAELKSVVSAIKKNSNKYLTAMFVDEQSMLAVRSTLLNSGKAILGWIYDSAPTQQRRLMQQKWLVAVNRIAEAPGMTVDTKLWTVYPELEFFQMDHPDAKTPPPTLVDKVKHAVQVADRSVVTDHERQAVISGAGYLLRLVGAFNEASRLMTKELSRTKSPWYYQSSLARLEAARGNKQKALAYSEQAWHSAQGRATRVQWLAADLELSIKLKSNPQDLKRIERLLKTYYATVFELEDGFYGRNYTSLEKLSRDLAPFKSQGQIAAIFKENMGRCNKISADVRQRCTNHFKKLESVP